MIYDKVICVDTGGVSSLTLNKVYDAKMLYDDIRSNYVGIIDDVGNFRNFKKARFKLLSEFRADKLNTIGI